MECEDVTTKTRLPPIQGQYNAQFIPSTPPPVYEAAPVNTSGMGSYGVSYHTTQQQPAVHYVSVPGPVTILRPPLQNPPKDFLLEALLVTLCCFMLTGIIAIVKAIQTRQAIDAGLATEAEKNSSSTRLWVCLSLWIGVVEWVITGAFIACYFAWAIFASTYDWSSGYY